MNLYVKSFFSVLFVFSFSTILLSKERIKEAPLWERYYESGGSNEAQIEALNNLIDFYEHLDFEMKRRDSINDVLIDYALHTHDVDLILRTYTFYFEGISTTNEKSIAYLKNIRQLSERTSSKLILWHAIHFEAIINFENQKFAKAIALEKQAIDVAKELKTVELELKSLIQIGLYYDWAGEKKRGLESFLQALDLANKENLPAYIVEAYTGISRMFFATHNFSKALEYREKCLEIILSNDPIDSISLLEQKYSIIETETYINFNEDFEQKIEEEINFAFKRKFSTYYYRLWVLYRSNLIENLRYGKLYDLYNVKYPEELVKAKEDSSDLYLRLKAYFHEHERNIDSAKYYWASAINYIDGIDNNYLKAHHYSRYAEFLIRVDDYNLAYKMAANSYKWALESKFLEFQYEALELLETIEFKRKKYQEAYSYANSKYLLKEEIDKKTEQEGLLVMELQHEVERRLLIQKKEEENQQAEMRASQLKANAFGVGLVLFLLLSGVIFRQYRQTRKEKERSDELLLNILPADTALELKNTGKTTAHQYVDVTVLFCDIVGFTKVAEQLTPEELVKEIDTYFRAFDEIIDVYGLEKIKTVGDAYVAVGGMPLHNVAGAKEVVNASIEMLNRVNVLSMKRKLHNRPAFQLRVGLHTGSVVAGVVGSKKFQYDIWGDAVNIAARMEQNSEPGKINISDVTYEAVKDEFVCVPRGKIEAKNKGMIEMYFVEFDLT